MTARVRRHTWAEGLSNAGHKPHQMTPRDFHLPRDFPCSSIPWANSALCNWPDGIPRNSSVGQPFPGRPWLPAEVWTHSVQCWGPAPLLAPLRTCGSLRQGAAASQALSQSTESSRKRAQQLCPPEGGPMGQRGGEQEMSTSFPA